MRTALWLGGFLLISLFYLKSLGHPSLWLDEAWEANAYMGITPAPWYNRPILYMGLIRLLVRLFGPSEVVLRLLPCAAGLGTILATWLVARREMGAACSLLAPVLLAISPTFLYEAHQLKHYTLDALFSCLLILSYGEYRRRRTAASLVLTTFTAMLSLGFSFTGAFIAAAIAIAELAPAIVGRVARLARRERDRHGTESQARRQRLRAMPPPSRGQVVGEHPSERGEPPGSRTPSSAQGGAAGTAPGTAQHRRGEAGSPRREGGMAPWTPPRPEGGMAPWTPLLAALAFGIVFVLVYRAFHASAGHDRLLTEYFVDAWPPLADPAALPRWLARQTAVLAEVAGTDSFLATALVLAGGFWWDWRNGTGLVSAIFLLGLLLNLAASVAYVYPYGSARLMVFLAPLLSLLLSAGIVQVFSSSRPSRGPATGGLHQEGPAAEPSGARAIRASVHGLVPRSLVLCGLLYVFLHPALLHARPYLSSGWGTDELRRLISMLADEQRAGEGILVAERADPSFSYYWYRNGRGTDRSDVVSGERHRLRPEEHAGQISAVAGKYETLWVLFYDQSRAERDALSRLLGERYETVRRVGDRDASSLVLLRRK